MQANAPPSMWAEACEYVLFIRNRLPCFWDEDSKTYISRQNVFEGNKRPYDLESLRVFGSEAWAYIPKGYRTGQKSSSRAFATQHHHQQPLLEQSEKEKS